MTPLLWVLLGICVVCLWGPFLYMMLTPPKLSRYKAPSPLELYRAETKQRVARALRREGVILTGDNEVAEQRREV